jgi:hypothetical protein
MSSWILSIWWEVAVEDPRMTSDVYRDALWRRFILGQSFLLSLRGNLFSVFGCRWAPTGYRFSISHSLHRITSTSAHGFLDPLLKFSILLVEDFPGIRIDLQRLQIVLLISGAHLAWVLRPMEEI